jgi:RNA polymerase sigma-54 factor
VVEFEYHCHRAAGRAMAGRQQMFLEHGPLAMKPFGLSEIANEVGVHASTVSRTVHNKYVATPAGVFEMQYFFSRGPQHTGSGASRRWRCSS